MNDEVQAVQETATAVAEVATKPGMSTGAKAGIVGGIVAIGVATGAGITYFIKKRKAKKAAKAAEATEPTESK
jgi:uncharacterized protein HemX